MSSNKEFAGVSPALPVAPLNADPLLDPTSFGRYIGGEQTPITVATLADWRCKGIGPAYVKVGRLVRYRKSAGDAWLESRTKRGA